jgi:UDP:flavonoid glycosyltransferase YjiC (YdhE family)
MICLFPNCAFLSETSRMLALHAALRAAGESVCIASHGGPFEHLITSAGVEWAQLEPRMDPKRCAQFLRHLPGIGSPRQSMYSDDELLAHVRGEAEFLRERGIRVAVTGFTLTLLLSTRVVGIPLVTSHAGSYVPPVFEAGLVPAPVRSGSLLRLLPRALKQKLMNWLPPRSHWYCGGFNRVASHLGVEGIPSFAALLLGDLTLITDHPQILGLEPSAIEAWRPDGGSQYRTSTRLRYSGPLYARLEVPLPERVNRFLDQEGTTAYIALTSASESMVRGAVAAVKRAGIRALVASTVHRLDDLHCSSVMVEPLLPSHIVMPRTALAVVTGGQGSIQTAVASGIPVVGIPLHAEQELNVHLVERQGMSLRVAPPTRTGSGLTAAVRTVLDQPSFRANALRLKQVVAGVDGPAWAAKTLLDHFATPGSRQFLHA